MNHDRDQNLDMNLFMESSNLYTDSGMNLKQGQDQSLIMIRIKTRIEIHIQPG